MEEIVQRARDTEGNLFGGWKPIPSPIKVGGSNDGGTEVQISQEARFDFVFNEEEEVQKQG